MTEVYYNLLQLLGDEERASFSDDPEPALVYESQRVWQKHLEATSACLHAINPAVSADEWKALLIEKRTSQLNELLKDINV